MSVKEYGWVGSDHLVSLGFILNECEDQKLKEYSKELAKPADVKTKKEKLVLKQRAHGVFVQEYHPMRIVIAAISLALVTICIFTGCFFFFKKRGICKRKNKENVNEQENEIQDQSAGYGTATPTGTIQVAVTESSIDIEN